jgi:hypothetical protein
LVKLLVLLVLVLSIGYAMYDTVAGAQTRCEVCLDIRGEVVCRAGVGASEEEARTAAQESACGGNTRNMSESIMCRNAVPVSAQCGVR